MIKKGEPFIWNVLEKAFLIEEEIDLKDWLPRAKTFLPAIELNVLGEMDDFFND